jgi:hypothetical protein
LGREGESDRLEAESLSMLKMVRASTRNSVVKPAATAAYACCAIADCASLREINRGSGR